MNRQIENLTDEEYKAVSQLKQKLLKQIGDDIEIILFGSQARGNATSESDIDILLLVNGDKSDKLQIDSELRDKIWSIAYDIEFENNFEIDFQIVLRSKEWWEYWKDALPFAQNVEKEGIWL